MDTNQNPIALSQLTWPEVETYIATGKPLLLPLGSFEQHGPMGLMGTDYLCAETVAMAAARIADWVVAPPLIYTPAPFNMAFAGTVSVSVPTFTLLLEEVCRSFISHGFSQIYLLNGHGANLEPARQVIENLAPHSIKLRSWWDFDEVQDLRQKAFGKWEGMHATPAEISITQVNQRRLDPDLARDPPVQLSYAYINAHSGDRHADPISHQRTFPDGRVGSHSALASPHIGAQLIALAAQAIVDELNDLTDSNPMHTTPED
jgi:creatinine amidohydrolase